MPRNPRDPTFFSTPRLYHLAGDCTYSMQNSKLSLNTFHTSTLGIVPLWGHTSHQYFCLLFGYPLPSKCGRHLSIAPMAKTLPGLWRHCKFLWRIAARGREGLIDCQLPRENEDINACASVQNKRSAARGILA